MKLYITAPSVFVLIVFYLPVVLWVLWRIGRSPRWRGMKKAGVMLLALLLAYAIPLGDVTYNSMAMAKVCPRAGLHIYKTVEVDGFIGTTSLRDTLYQFNEEPVLRVEAVEKPKFPQKIAPRSAIISLRDKTKVEAAWHGSNRYTKA
ncbi:MAG: hypothetical protein PHU06_02870, partial [Gallionella sp.]|nr:hypothetical protein [Gallionella sp.]